MSVHEKYGVHVAVEIMDDGTSLYAAWTKEYPGCIAEGDTAEQAVSELRSLLPRVMAGMRERGVIDQIPLPVSSMNIRSVTIVDAPPHSTAAWCAGTLETIAAAPTTEPR